MAFSTTLHLAALKDNVWSPMGLCSPQCREHSRPPSPPPPKPWEHPAWFGGSNREMSVGTKCQALLNFKDGKWEKERSSSWAPSLEEQKAAAQSLVQTCCLNYL